jgi:hypothetical protein
VIGVQDWKAAFDDGVVNLEGIVNNVSLINEEGVFASPQSRRMRVQPTRIYFSLQSISFIEVCK